MEFLLNFFEFGAGDFAFAYIRPLVDELSLNELRTLAAALGRAEQWTASMWMVSTYMEKEDWTLDRRDLELSYPRPFRELIESNAEANGVPPELLFSLIRTESAFIPDNRSRVGAMGLTQLMSDTALEMADRIRRQGGPDYSGTAPSDTSSPGGIDLRDPAVNIHLGAYYLNYLMERMENPLMSLLAYNGGMGRIRRWRAADPHTPADLFMETIELSETREYGRKVSSAAAVYGYLYYGMTMEAVLADIYSDAPHDE
jgi:soluble lytic murein transglycosylase